MKSTRNIKLFFAMLILVIASKSFGVEKYDLDMAHSSINFNVSHMVLAKVHGSFSEYMVDLYFDSEDISKSSVKSIIEVSSISTRNEERDNHLKSPDFFDAAKYPKITFISKEIKKVSDNFLAVGNLTIRDVTKEVEIPFGIKGPITDPWGNTRFGIEATLEINRQDYGVKWSRTLDNGGLVAGNIVEIEIFLEVFRAK